MTTPLQNQILDAINSIRPYLYGSNLRVQLLQFDGTDRQYKFLVELQVDYIVSVDRLGNLTLMLVSNQYDEAMRKMTHMVFDGWLYQLTEPAKPNQGPFPMWKVTGRGLGARYIAEP